MAKRKRLILPYRKISNNIKFAIVGSINDDVLGNVEDCLASGYSVGFMVKGRKKMFFAPGHDPQQIDKLVTAEIEKELAKQAPPKKKPDTKPKSAKPEVKQEDNQPVSKSIFNRSGDKNKSDKSVDKKMKE